MPFRRTARLSLVEIPELFDKIDKLTTEVIDLDKRGINRVTTDSGASRADLIWDEHEAEWFVVFHRDPYKPVNKTQ